MTEQYLQRNINDQGGGGGGNNPQSASFFDDFTSASTASALGWTALSNGSGSGVFPQGAASSSQTPGVFRFTTGTSPGGRGRLRLGPNSTSWPFPPIRNVPPPGFLFVEWGFRILELATPLQDYFINFGMNDGNSGGQGNNGCYFRYDLGANPESANWVAVCDSGGVETSFNTGIAVLANVDLKLRVEFNTNSAQFFLAEYGEDFSQVASINTNIPNSTQSFSPQAVIQKQSTPPPPSPREMLVD
jgi:hypothetical protein